MISDLTYKVVAYSEVPHFNADDCVNWSIEMLELGYETESLLILAGLSKPVNYFETIDYLKRAFLELNLKEKTGHDGIYSYSKYLISKIASGKDVRESLKEARLFCESKNYEASIYDFYLLYWAWDDLDINIQCQMYWPGANAKNINRIVKEVADKWILENEQRYALHFS